MLKHIEKITNVTCRVASGLAEVVGQGTLIQDAGRALVIGA
jgi:hypothetical protein